MENQSTTPVDTDDIPATNGQTAPETQAESSTAGTVLVPPKTSMVGRWILILLATLIVGFGAAFFALFLPANLELKQLKTDLAAAQEKLTTTEADLTATSATLETANTELAAARFNRELARVEVNVAYARLSLVTRDLLTARQEVSAASGNMAVLLTLITDQETATALKDRMDGIQKTIITDSAKALEELRTLSENLLRLENR
jgi:septal ring factor EnvC (AmiA/AmiB activator)